MKDKNLFFGKTAKDDFNLRLEHISNIEITHEPKLFDWDEHLQRYVPTFYDNYFELQFDVYDYEWSPIKHLKTPDDGVCRKMDYVFSGTITIADENEYLYGKKVQQIDLYYASVVSCSDSNDNDTVTITVRANKGVLGKDLY